MRRVTVIAPLAFVAHAHAKNLAGAAQEVLPDAAVEQLIGNLIDEMVDQASFAKRSDLDKTTFGRLGMRRHVVMTRSAIFPSHSPLSFPRSRVLSGRTRAFYDRLGKRAYDFVEGFAKSLSLRPKADKPELEQKNIKKVILRFQKDMATVDQTPSARPVKDVSWLSIAVGMSAVTPFMLTEKVLEVLVPAMASLTVVSTGYAEFAGKAAVARGRELASIALQAAAESELYLAEAEEAKAIIPVAVGISAVAAALALRAPDLVKDLELTGLSASILTEARTEAYLICPLVAGLSAAVASLAATETRGLAGAAIETSNAAFESYADRAGSSAYEQIDAKMRSSRRTEKWASFSLSALPAPTLAVLFPGAISFKAIVGATVAAAQAAFSLVCAEYALASASESVALKSRSASLIETYSHQAQIKSAKLPYSSSITGLCTAAAIAIVEVLEFIPLLLGKSAVCTFFPAIGSFFSAAASIDRACAEVDAEIAAAASTVVTEGQSKTPIIATFRLIQLTARAAQVQLKRLVKWVGRLARHVMKSSDQDCATRASGLSTVGASLG